MRRDQHTRPRSARRASQRRPTVCARASRRRRLSTNVVVQTPASCDVGAARRRRASIRHPSVCRRLRSREPPLRAARRRRRVRRQWYATISASGFHGTLIPADSGVCPHPHTNVRRAFTLSALARGCRGWRFRTPTVMLVRLVASPVGLSRRGYLHECRQVSTWYCGCLTAFSFLGRRTSIRHPCTAEQEVGSEIEMTIESSFIDCNVSRLSLRDFARRSDGTSRPRSRRRVRSGSRSRGRTRRRPRRASPASRTVSRPRTFSFRRGIDSCARPRPAQGIGLRARPSITASTIRA